MKKLRSRQIFIMRMVALAITAGIAFTIILPPVFYNRSITIVEMTGLFLCVACMVVIIVSDRIVSLDFSKNELRIKLSNMRQELGETIKEVRETVEDIASSSSSSVSSSSESSSSGQL